MLDCVRGCSRVCASIEGVYASTTRGGSLWCVRTKEGVRVLARRAKSSERGRRWCARRRAKPSKVESSCDEGIVRVNEQGVVWLECSTLMIKHHCRNHVITGESSGIKT